MINYLIGFIKNLFNPAVSLFSLVDNSSTVDKKSKVHRAAKVFHSNLGKYSYLGKDSSLVYADVGSFCSIAADVRVGLGYHYCTRISTSPLFSETKNGTGHSWTRQESFSYKKVIVGNDVWIGERAIIMGGITIGDGAVIGAGAVVTKDVPPYAIVGGVPAKLIRFRFSQEIVDFLLNLKWWNYSEQTLRGGIKLFQDDITAKEQVEKLKQLLNRY